MREDGGRISSAGKVLRCLPAIAGEYVINFDEFKRTIRTNVYQKDLIYDEFNNGKPTW